MPVNASGVLADIRALAAPFINQGGSGIQYNLRVQRHHKKSVTPVAPRYAPSESSDFSQSDFLQSSLSENVGSHITATIQKIITEILGDKSGLTFGKDARDLLIDCSVEFITLISSEANEIAEKESKKTIAAEHIDKALRELGFPEYVSEVLAVAGEHKEQLKASISTRLREGLADGLQTREKKTNKLQDSGLTDEQLLQQQQELFRSATEKYNSGPA
ncbi:hypothetical protein MMC26_000697 [Xylographa opegraphella]|nr:hypothetical protein [Xylographa opegraphella]